MKYQEAMDYIEKCGKYGIVPGLAAEKELLRRLQDPQKELKIIHIAGTNGKGSVLSFISQILYENGYRVGRYLSPTLYEYREKFQIQQKPISKSKVANLMEEVAKEADQMEQEGFSHPTPFEIETAMALLLFKQENCDFVVLETGMGGLLDATNVIENPMACILTSVSKDHMQFLGETLEEISVQKAGIMKKNAWVISADQPDKITAIWKEKAKEVGVRKLIYVKPEEIQGIRYGLKTQKFNYGKYKNLEITMLGVWQIENACLAMKTIECLQTEGYIFEEDKIRKGLQNAFWEGRFQIIGKKPYFVVDGAHNVSSAAKLKKSLEFYFTNKRIIYIIGMFKDKEYEGVLRETYDMADHIITITIQDNPRSLSSLELAQTASRYHPRVTTADSLEEAIELSYLLAEKDSVIIAFGSLSYLGKCTEIVKKRLEMGKKTHGK